LIIEAITCKSIPDIKYKIKKAMQVQKDENNQVQQLTQKLEEADKQLKDMSK
jgi:ribosomal protein S12